MATANAVPENFPLALKPSPRPSSRRARCLVAVVAGSYTGLHNLINPGVNNNQVDQWGYDAAGDVQNDLVNMYECDAEGRQTGVVNQATGLTGYVYDAEGRRVEKVLVRGWNTPNPTTTIENEYLPGLGGEQFAVRSRTEFQRSARPPSLP